MYKIEKADFGVKLTFGGFIRAEEMQQWLDESIQFLEDIEAPYGVFVDMRTLKPLPADSQKPMFEGQQFYKQKGMNRSVVILANAITTLQFRRIARQTGIAEWERYINANQQPNFEELGLRWLVDADDSDIK